MRVTFTVPVLALFALLAACRSDPVHYHTLTPLLSATPRTSASVSPLQVERVTVPPQVDRSQIVVRQGTNELVILETNWWGANLADEIASTLTNQLDARSGTASKALLRMDVQRFDLVPGQYALIEAKWRIRRGQHGDDDASELICRSLLQTPSGVSVEDLVMAQQGNLQKLVVIISDTLRSGAARCP